jgi:hypothetical protein
MRTGVQGRRDGRRLWHQRRDTTPERVKKHVNEIYAKVGLSDRSL